MRPCEALRRISRLVLESCTGILVLLVNLLRTRLKRLPLLLRKLRLDLLLESGLFVVKVADHALCNEGKHSVVLDIGGLVLVSYLQSQLSYAYLADSTVQRV